MERKSLGEERGGEGMVAEGEGKAEVVQVMVGRDRQVFI